MVNVLQGMQYVQQQGELGRQRGTQSRLGSLASQAYGAAPEAQRGFVQQAIQADPQAGFAMNKQLGDDRGQRLQSMSQRARMLVAYAKAGNRQGVDSLYPQIAQEASQLGLGQNIPDAWDDAYLPGMEQLANIGGGVGGNVQSTFVDDQGNRVAIMRDGSTQVLGQNNANIRILEQEGQLPYGVVTSGGRPGQVMPLGGGAPAPQQGAPMQPQGQMRELPAGNASHPNQEVVLAAANQMAQAGMPDEQISAWIQQQLSQPTERQGRPMPQQAPATAPQGAALPPALDYQSGGQVGPVRVPTTGEKAAAAEAAKLQTQLQYGPALQAMETQGAIDRAVGTQQAATQLERQQALPKLQQQRAILQDALDGLGTKYRTGPLNTVIPDALQSADNQVFLTVVNQAVLEAAEQLTGVISDKDMEFLKRATVSLTTREDANKEILRRKLKIVDDGIAKAQGGGDRLPPALDYVGGGNAQPGSSGQAGGRRMRFNPATGRLE